jgi:hypothetical protein
VRKTLLPNLEHRGAGHEASPTALNRPLCPVPDMALERIPRLMQEQPTSTGRQDRSTSGRGGAQNLGTILSVAALAIAVLALALVTAIPKPPPTPPPRIWANVNANGTLEGGSGIQFVTHTSIGYYFIAFDSNPTGCAQVATPYGYPPADLLADPYYGPGPGEDNLYIFSATNGAPVNSSFSLVVYC